MEIKVCGNCKTEKNFDNFYNKYRECIQCNIDRSLKRYSEINDKLSNQRKLIFEKNRDVLLAKSKLNQQHTKHERKFYIQQIKKLKKS